MKQNLRDYLKQDRQWRKEHRINHAVYQLNKASDPKEKDFWRAVIKVNKDD